MDLSSLSPEERSVAEQAVVTLRALKEAAATAPMGQGMNVLEGVIHDRGLEHLRQMTALAAASRSEAQKWGLHRAVRLRAQKQIQVVKPADDSHEHRPYEGAAALLPVCPLRRFAGCSGMPGREWGGVL